MDIHVVGGGLAGSEAAWQLAERGHDVVVHEMRPVRATPAHKTERLGELVCSNTFKSTETSNAHGLLKAEMRVLGSLILSAADQARVPGGSALTVDRDVFSRAIHERVMEHPRITVVREEVTALPDPGIVATGPLTSDALAEAIRARLGLESLAFYDAIAPIVAHDSIDQDIVFRASRYGKETMPMLGAPTLRAGQAETQDLGPRTHDLPSDRPHQHHPALGPRDEKFGRNVGDRRVDLDAGDESNRHPLQRRRVSPCARRSTRHE